MAENEAKLERIFEKQFEFFSFNFTTTRITLISILLIVYSISYYLEAHKIWALFLGGFFLIILALSIYLRKKKILYIFDFNLECSEAGDIFLTKLHGHCPKCEGHLKIRRNKKASFIQCDKEHKHIWNLFEIKEKEEKKSEKED